MNEDIAADYVLGWMTAAERKATARQIERDGALKEAVDSLEACLHPLTLLAELVTPPAEIWEKIRARLDQPSAKPAPRTLWALGGGAAIAAMAAFFIIASQPKTLYQAQLLTTAGATEVAEIEATSHDELIIRPEALPTVPSEKSYELWIIPAGGKPQSLGLMQGDKPYKIHLAGITEHETLAISVEPLGGSPTGAPTGPVIVAGELHRL